ncbi:MAG: hypothetical protein HP496_12485 [Nitrospira sp.]|nr:hypothetical protein [Nitrospira sp.]
MGISTMIGLGVCWSLSYAGPTGDERAVLGPATSGAPVSSSAGMVTDAAAGPMPSAAMPVENGLVLRTVPTVSKQISVRGTRLVPYIGAGFGGGYLTEFERLLNPAQSMSSGSLNVGLKSLLGQQLMPNEVQLGIRFPF